jgi:lipid II:glycine glycyltransferase (peptidoglycan interpeptide bridge formation enzyme)
MFIIEKDLGFGNGTKTAEAYYTNPQEVQKKFLNKYDIVFFIQGSTAKPPSSAREFWTSVVDLSPTTEELFNKLAKKTRYEIRKTIRDNIVVNSVLRQPTREEAAIFCKKWKQFREDKKLDDDGGKSQRFYESNIHELSQKGAYIITYSSAVKSEKAQSQIEESLCQHGYIFDGTRARLNFQFLY